MTVMSQVQSSSSEPQTCVWCPKPREETPLRLRDVQCHEHMYPVAETGCCLLTGIEASTSQPARLATRYCCSVNLCTCAFCRAAILAQPDPSHLVWAVPSICSLATMSLYSTRMCSFRGVSEL